MDFRGFKYTVMSFGRSESSLRALYRRIQQFENVTFWEEKAAKMNLRGSRDSKVSDAQQCLLGGQSQV